MNKFNRRFNTKCRRYERWHRIVGKLNEFQGLINSYESASPEEIRVLREIHSKLYECLAAAKFFEEELRPYGQLLR